MKYIDSILNHITMYRLVLYVLIFLVVVADIFCFLGIIPYDGFLLIGSAAFLIIVSWITNTVFAKVFNAPTNLESIYISALILALIITPIRSVNDLPLLFWAAIWTAASKFIVSYKNKHLFNPVAFSVALTAFTLDQSASWWVGTLAMAPFVLICGGLMVRKIRRFDLVFYFFLTAFATVGVFTILKGGNLISALYRTVFNSSLLFFAFIMLTEPLTTPPTKKLQSIYGGLVGILFVPQFHISSFTTTPEIALLIGNIFSYLVSPKQKLILKLKQKIELAPDIFEFIFTPNQKIKFTAGQYMEWTLGHSHPDERGNRRYFTLASSPTELDLRMGIKFYNHPSSYKTALMNLNDTHEIVAGQLAGDFTLPKNANKKLVFIAGGIGVTPFRSMVKYLIDTNQKRDIALFYSNKLISEVVYHEVFTQAANTLQMKTIYTLTDAAQIPYGWQGKIGIVDERMIREEVPDFKDRMFYISGPFSMIESFKKTLSQMGISKSQIKTDFFPGFA